MTAETTGKAVCGAWATLKRLRERWILVTALVSGLFWAKDLVEIYARLPDDLARQSEAVTAVEARLDRLAAEIRPGLGRGAVTGMARGAIPAHGQTPDALGRGDWLVLRWRLDRSQGPGCTVGEATAVLTDAEGRVVAVPTGPIPLPGLEDGQGLAFGVKVRPRTAVGRARLRLLVVQSCPDRQRARSSAWLDFRVRAERAPGP